MYPVTNKKTLADKIGGFELLDVMEWEGYEFDKFFGKTKTPRRGNKLQSRPLH